MLVERTGLLIDLVSICDSLDEAIKHNDLIILNKLITKANITLLHIFLGDYLKRS